MTRPSAESWQETSREAVRSAMLSGANVARAKRALTALTPDPTYTGMILDAIAGGRLDLRLGVAWVASVLEPQTYLEIGVRRGFSMAVLASMSPHATIYGFDLWVKDYVGVANPGPTFVRRELARVGFAGEVTFVGGDSHRTLPRFFGESRHPWPTRLLGRGVSAPPAGFDMALVDGDHSIQGAYQDLSTVMGHIKVGGAVLFDDIAPDLSQFDEAGLEAIRRELGPDPRRLGGLMGVWRAIQAMHPEFRYFDFPEDSPGLGIGFRTR